ncbi:MAG: D-alanyl-D-alanine carboxypeptidase, partial [Candidatus Kapaibacterium sp.]
MTTDESHVAVNPYLRSSMMIMTFIRRPRSFFLLWAVLLAAAATSLPLRAQEESAEEEPSSPSALQRITSADSAANRQQLVRNLHEIVNRTESRRGRISAAVYSLDRNRMIFDHRSGDALTPASTTKLFYTYAAMKLLGPDYGIPTTVVTDGTVGPDSVLRGNVYLVGHGDCLLTPNDIEALAEQLRRSGIRSVIGDVVGDASFFDPVSERQQYSGDAERMQDMPPISALGINRNMVTVLVSASGAGGTHVQTIPQSAAFRINAAERSSGSIRTAPATDAPSPSMKPSPSSVARNRTSGLRGMVPRIRTAGAVAQRSRRSVRRGAGTHRANVRGVPDTRKGPRNSHRGRKHRRRHALLMPLYPAYGTEGCFGDMRIPLRRLKRSRAPRGPRVSVSSSMGPGGIQTFSVRGSLPRNMTRTYTYEIGRPALATAGVLLRALQA